jgi:hypothetical protein
VRPGLLVDLPCSAPGAIPVLPEAGADVVAVPEAAFEAGAAGRWDDAPVVPGRDGVDTFKAPSAPDGRCRVGPGTFSPPRDRSWRPRLVPSAGDAAAPR